MSAVAPRTSAASPAAASAPPPSRRIGPTLGRRARSLPVARSSSALDGRRPEPAAAVTGYRRGVNPSAAAVVLAGGSGTRLSGNENKVYLPLAGRRLVSWALQAFADVQSVHRLVLVVRPADRALAESTVDREVRA